MANWHISAWIVYMAIFSANMKLREYKSQIIKFKDGEQVFIEKLSKNGDKIAEQEQIILSQKMLLLITCLR